MLQYCGASLIAKEMLQYCGASLIAKEMLQYCGASLIDCLPDDTVFYYSCIRIHYYNHPAIKETIEFFFDGMATLHTIQQYVLIAL